MHYKPETTGNAPYTTALAKSLADAGADVHVITGIPHYPQWQVDDPKYRRGSYWAEYDGSIRLTRCRHWVPSVPNLFGRLLMEASFFSRAAFTAAKDKSDIVICVTPMLSGLAAGLLSRRKRPVAALVQDLTGNAAVESGTTGSKISRAIASAEYSLLRRCSLVGVITPRFRDILIRNGVAGDRILDVSNFTHITPTDTTRQAARARLGWDPETSMVIHTGNMGRKQGLENVVEAARLLDIDEDKIEFVLVGDGSQREQLEQDGVGLATLRFHDPVNEETYPFVLAAADILLVNEKAGVKEMSLPSKLTSYTAAARPIMAAIEPEGITYQTLHESGIAVIVRTGDPQALVRSIKHLLHDPDRAKAIATTAFTYYLRHFTPAAAADRYRNFAQALASKRQSTVKDDHAIEKGKTRQ